MKPIRAKRTCLVLLTLLVSGASNAETLEAQLEMDTYTRSNLPNNNFGSESIIKVQNWGDMTGFLRFDLSAVPIEFGAEVATLKIFVQDVKAAGTVGIHKVESGWHENIVTASSQPPIGAESDQFNVARGNSIVEIDVTNVVNELLALRLDEDSLGIQFGIALVPHTVNVWFKSLNSGQPATLTIEMGPIQPWPKVACPCDQYFNRAMAVYASVGGSLSSPNDPRNPPGYMICDILVPTINDHGGLEFIETLVVRSDSASNAQLVLSISEDSNRTCYVEATSTPSPYAVRYSRRVDGLSEQEYMACVISAKDVCRDW